MVDEILEEVKNEDAEYQKYYDEHFAEFSVISKNAIKREFSVDLKDNYNFSAEELEAISLCANGADVYGRAKKNWAIVEPEEEGQLTLQCAEEDVDLVKKIYSMALFIYDASVELDLNYMSDFEYVAYIAEVLRKKSKFTVYFDEEDM